MMASVAPLLLVIASIVALGVTGNLLVPSPLVIAVQAAAIGLSIWARRSFQKGAFRVTATPGDSPLIRNGPYRFVRHPMYAAALFFTWAAVISHVSAFTLAVGLAVSGIAIARVVVEERLLRSRYSDYENYARSTKALVPYVF
jgi:protein-S-isoprenylcysteine O-methyltransferase Ste14